MKHNIVTFTSITVFALSGIIFWETGLLWIVWPAIILFYFSITAYGSFSIQSNYFLQSVNRGKKKSVALTFDDGPHPETTPMILDILRGKNLQATFFVIGKNVERYPDLLRRIHEEGHTIGNHTYSHHHLLGFFTTAKLRADISNCSQVIEEIIGVKPAFFRPPFGVTNPRYATVLKELNINSVGWSLRSLDTRAKNRYQLINKIIASVKPKDIILLHDTQKVTAESLEDVIEHCLQKGIRIVPLPHLIQKEAYVRP